MNFYSATTRAFYATDIHGDSMPADAVAVSDDDYAALFVAQSAGMEIQPGDGGGPVALPPPAADPKVVAQAQIDAIERETMTNRGARELHIGIMRREGQAMGLADDAAIAARVPYFKKLIDIDAQIRALRAQL